MSPRRGDSGRSDAIGGDPTLQRRYRRLLWAYPKAYRAARGDEIVGTLLDAARPGQRRPGVRESSGLLLGGLRTRTGATVLTWRDLWLGAVDVAMLMMLLVTALPALTDITESRLVIIAPGIAAGLAIAAMEAILLRRYLLAFVPVLALTPALWYQTVAGYDAYPLGGDMLDAAVDAGARVSMLLLGLALLAFAVPRRSPPPAGAVLRIAGMVLVTLPLAVMPVSGTMNVNSWVVAALILACPVISLMSAIVDPRLPIAFGITVLYFFLPYVVYMLSSDGPLHAGVLGYLAIYLGVMLTYVAVGWRTGQRRIRT
jgi:hypothetical protein